MIPASVCQILSESMKLNHWYQQLWHFGTKKLKKSIRDVSTKFLWQLYACTKKGNSRLIQTWTNSWYNSKSLLILRLMSNPIFPLLPTKILKLPETRFNRFQGLTCRFCRIIYFLPFFQQILIEGACSFTVVFWKLKIKDGLVLWRI